MPTLDEVLAQAKSGAANLTPATPGTAIQSQPTGSSVSYNMNEDAFLNGGGMEVDSYIQVKDAGLRLSKDWAGFIDEFEATIDMRDVAFFMGIRREVGKNVDYARTYDGVTTSKGENFQQVVSEFKATSQKPADPYRGADIPLVLTQGYADPKDPKKAMEADSVVGLTTSITGFKPWANFHKKAKAAGLGTSVLKVRVSHSPRKNAAGQEYGVCEFELIDIVEDNRPATSE